VSAVAGLIRKGKLKSSMLPLDGELFDAAEDTCIIEKTNGALFLFIFSLDWAAYVIGLCLGSWDWTAWELGLLFLHAWYIC
jgi:hypothetical protein